MAEQFHLYDEVDPYEFMRTHRNTPSSGGGSYMGRTNENIYDERINPNFKRMDKKFMNAVNKGKNIEVLDKMLKKGADPNCYERDPYDEVIYDEELYDELTDPAYNKRDDFDGYTQRYKRKHKGIYNDAMTKAIKSNNTNVAVWLINQGYVCKPYTKNPLILAMEMGNDTLVNTFLENKDKMRLVLNPTSIYNINVDGYKNPLVAAIKLNKPQYFEKLIKNGANLVMQDGAAINEVFSSTNPRMVEILFDGLQDQRQARALTSSSYKFDTLFTKYYERHGDNLIQRQPINNSVALKAFELMDNPPIDLVNDIVDKALSENNFDVLEDLLLREDIDFNRVDMKDVIQKAIENQDVNFLQQILDSNYKLEPSTALEIVRNVDGILGPDKARGMDSVNKEIKALFLDIIDNNYSPEDLKKLAQTLGEDKEGIIFDMLKKSNTPLPPEIRHFARYMRRHGEYKMMHEMYDHQKQFNNDTGPFFLDLILGFLGLDEKDDDIKGLNELAKLEEGGRQKVFNGLADNERFETMESIAGGDDTLDYSEVSKVIVRRIQKGFDEQHTFDKNSKFAQLLQNPKIDFDIDEYSPSGKLLFDVVTRGEYELADELIKNKTINVNYQDENGNSVALIAIDRREDPKAAEFCDLLLQREDLDRSLKNKEGLEVEKAINVFKGKSEIEADKEGAKEDQNAETSKENANEVAKDLENTKEKESENSNETATSHKHEHYDEYDDEDEMDL